MIDNTIAFLANPGGFIGANIIALNDVNNPGGIPAVNNLRRRFTLSTHTGDGGVPGPNDFPMLRIQAAGAPNVVALPAGGVLNTLDALYCRAGTGGNAFDDLPFCDILIAPAVADPHILFTTGMNGCALMIASVVPATATPLAAGHWRVMHDRNHHSLAEWHQAGYTIHFASYSDNVQAGVPPAGLAPISTNYNPHDYPWGYAGADGEMRMRVATNFLTWNGANWVFNSGHYHTSGALIINEDAPANGAASTQVINI